MQSTIKPEKKRIGSIISWILCILLFIIIAFEIVMKIRGKDAYIFNVRNDVVLTDSMSYKNKDEDIQKFLEGHDNQMQVGDWFFSTKVDEKTELNVYDIVIFQNIETGKETVHRIVDIYVDSKGTTRYIIRADTANAESYDGAYTRGLILAKVTFVIPWVGHIVRFLNSFFGMIFLIGLFVIIFVFDFLRDSPSKNQRILVDGLLPKKSKDK